MESRSTIRYEIAMDERTEDWYYIKVTKSIFLSSLLLQNSRTVSLRECSCRVRSRLSLFVPSRNSTRNHANPRIHYRKLLISEYLSIDSFCQSHTPVALSFDCRTDGVPTDEAAIEAAFDVEMTTKKKNGAQNVDHTVRLSLQLLSHWISAFQVVILRTVEDYTESLYLARERVLGLEETKRREDAPTYSNKWGYFWVNIVVWWLIM